MVRSTRGLLWSIAASVPLVLPCQADVIESTPGSTLTPAVSEAATEPAPIPEADAVTEEGAAAASKPGEPELIQERYPDRTVKVERYVVQDASGNYVNHGKWTMYDEKARMVGSGEYRYGERHGIWTRWNLPGTTGMLSQVPYKHFKPPFVSEATFENGQLHGTWAVYDSQDRKCSEFAFENDERQGKSTWYFPSGEKMREIDFTNGQLDGQWQEWGPGKNLTMNDTYQNGRRLAKKTETYPGGQPKSEAMYLFAREVLKTEYDWWNGTMTTKATKEGKDQRHGSYTAWFKNGQKDQEGQYLNDLPVGKFVWWYENGQKAIEGQFVNGDRTGNWAWWHDNGQKAVAGEFVKGVEIGKWTWWKEDGKVANSARISEGQSNVAPDEGVPGEPAIAQNPTVGKPTATPIRNTRTMNRNAPRVR